MLLASAEVFFFKALFCLSCHNLFAVEASVHDRQNHANLFISKFFQATRVNIKIDEEKMLLLPDIFPLFSIHNTCRDESSPPCRRVSDTSRLHHTSYIGHHHTGIHLRGVIVAFHLSFVLLAFFGIRTVPILAFFQSLFARQDINIHRTELQSTYGT